MSNPEPVIGLQRDWKCAPILEKITEMTLKVIQHP